jgi:hypothetical protein
MEEQIARLLAGIGILVWGLLALVSLFLEWRAGSSSPGPASAYPAGQAPKSSHSRAV